MSDKISIVLDEASTSLIESSGITGPVALTIPGDGTTAFGATSYGEQFVYVAEFNLSSSDLIGLSGSNLTLVANPGGGKVVVPLSCLVRLNYFGAAYTSPTLSFSWNGANPSWVVRDLLDSVTPTIRHFVPGDDTFPESGVPFTLSGSPVGGTSTLRIKLFYTIVSI